jgi:transposase
MALQTRLPLLPAGAQLLSHELAVAREDGWVILHHAGGPIMSFREDDAEGRRLAAAVLSQPSVNLAPPKALAEGLGIHRTMVFSYRRRYAEGGVAALHTQKPGPRGPHKLQGEKRGEAQAMLDKGASNRAVARALGMSEGAVRLALKQGRLVRLQSQGGAEVPSGPGERSERDRNSAGGVAVKRIEERVLARTGALVEAEPVFEAAASVAKGGVLAALPLVVAQGLYEVGEQVYGRLKNGFYGLDAVLSTLVFMALLRIKSIEQLPSHAPGEFGVVLGLDRSPEPKTLRRKLAELGAIGRALEFGAAFARRWARAEPELLGFLYVDGHVRPYNGRKHTLPKTHVPRRRLCMPATTDYWVNDTRSDPLFYVTAPWNEGLLAMLEDAVLPEARSLAGQRRVTLIMDRECWSPDSFEDWSRRGFDVMTYRKGRYDPWPEEDFTEHQLRDGRTRGDSYKLAERPLELSNGFEVRDVRRLTENGHQTSIVTTRTDLSALEVALRMFARWRQENFFRYMRHEFDLDHLPTPAVEAADPQRPVPNPARKAKKKELDAARQELAGLKQAYAEAALAASASSGTRLEGIRRKMQQQEVRVEQLRLETKALPLHVPVGQVRDPATVVKLERERKRITDQVKMVAYRAETEMAAMVAPLLGWHHGDEARSFLRQVFQLPAGIVPDPQAGTLNVRLHGMANLRSNRALAGLCEILNSYETCYPGTGLQLVLKPPQSEK